MLTGGAVVRGGVQLIARLFRFSTLGGTWIIVLLGAGSGKAGAHVDVGLLLALVASVGFHAAVYGWNDIFDLPLDRTEVRRASDPLVQGVISVRVAALLATGAAVLALAAAALAGLDSAMWMAGALALLFVYDAWGKRTPIPQCMDLIQGAGWGGLVLYGAQAVSAATATTVWVAIYVLLAITVINGVDGGIRDLVNDYRHRARTTAISLGVIPTEDGGIRISRRFASYAVCTQLMTTAVLFAGMICSGAGSLMLRLVLGMIGGVGGCLLLIAMLDRAPEGARSWHLGLAHIVIILVLPMLLIPGPFSLSFVLIALLMFGVPTAAIARFVLRWRERA